MPRYVVDLEEIDQTQVALAGGKGARLGALSRVDGVHVPPGFCVTTAAFQRIVAAVPAIGDHLDRLSRLAPDDREAIRVRGEEVRRTLHVGNIPDDVATAVTGSLARFGKHAAYAVRSSATVEDSSMASFAASTTST